MNQLHFAQISDIHISAAGDHHDMLSGQTAGFLTGVVARLNQIDDLDFTLITGDLFDTASATELARFQQVMGALAKPYYIIPGNHDRRAPDQSAGLTRHDFARLFNPQVSRRPAHPAAQAGYWSLAVAPEVQLIGLDSIRDDDWSGVIDSLQLDWLRHELAAAADKLVIVAVHHPLHPLAPIDADPHWRRFVLDNGPELLALLNTQPQVKLVLTGHHHLTKADRLGGRWHLAGPALATYPCAYRTIRLSWPAGELEWRTHPAANTEVVAAAQQAMAAAWAKAGFLPEFVAHHVALALGNDFDRNGRALL